MVRRLVFSTILCVTLISAGKADDIAGASLPRTLSSLLADGYEVGSASLVQGIVWLRKWSTTYSVTYICFRSPTTSEATEVRNGATPCWPASAGESQ
jgi:hypothetical protein